MRDRKVNDDAAAGNVKSRDYECMARPIVQQGCKLQSAAAKSTRSDLRTSVALVKSRSINAFNRIDVETIRVAMYNLVLRTSKTMR